MSEQTDTVYKLLESLGLSPEETHVFLYLNKNGESTALSISKGVHVSRTKVYRILDTLISRNLIIQLMGDRGLKFEVPSDLNLNLLLVKKENELEDLKKSIPVLQKELSDTSLSGRHASKVIYFHGKQGLEQVTWNSTKAKGILRIYEVSQTMDAFIDTTFSEKVRKEFVKNGVRIKQITNLKKISGYTSVTELVRKYWECRYVDSKKLSIKFETIIYNDVLVLYTYSNDDIFCIEVHNPYLAEMQAQIFDFIWDSSTPLKILGDDGTAHLI